MRDKDPMVKLREANPAPETHAKFSADPPSRSRRMGHIALAIIGVMALGTGVGWAASGGNPIASIFSGDVEIVRSPTGTDSLAILQPATQQAFDALPPDLAFRASAMAVQLSTIENVKNGKPPFFERRADSRTKGFDPVPVQLSALGRGRTSTGSRVTLMVLAGQICGYIGLRGPGLCGSTEALRSGKLVGGGSEEKNPSLWRVYGVVADDVATIRVAGSNIPPATVSDNMFELRNMKRFFGLPLIGLDENGNQVFGPGLQPSKG